MANREIGGYIEIDLSGDSRLHQGAIALNSGRNCVAYLALSRGIKKLLLPDYMCDSVSDLCERSGIAYRKYKVTRLLEPDWDFSVDEGEYLYLVDYYGQMTEVCFQKAIEVSNGRLILDEAQSLFSLPRLGVDTLYSPRKFLGIPDGGYLYTDAPHVSGVPKDKSSEHMHFLLGRYEDAASNYYSEYQENNERFLVEPLKRMSKLTKGLISSIDLERVKTRRLENYRYLAARLDVINELKTRVPLAPFAYPLLVKNGSDLRKRLIARKMYIPTLWPNVLLDEDAGSDAKHLTENLLPLPVDQRYGCREMNAILSALEEEGVLRRELEGKTVVLLGGTLISCQIVEAAKQLGLKTIVLDYNSPEDSPAKRIADGHVLLSVADVDEVAAYIRDNDIDGVICGYADSILGFYADICEKAGLPCYGTKELFRIYTNKKLWKDECRRFGVPTAREYEDSILSCDEAEIPFPLFVKPIVGSGAQGTGVARNKRELLEAHARAEAVSKGSGVLIEDYLEGCEVTVFWLMIDGKYYVTQIGNRLVKHNQEGVIPLPTGYTFPSSVIPAYLSEVAPKVKAMFASQGVKNGMMFMQCIVRDGIPYVYDIGYRLTGSLEHLLLKDVAGYSPMDMLLRFAVTGVMNRDQDIVEKIERGLYSSCFNVSCLMEPGTIDHFEGIDQLENDENVFSCVKAHVEGETLPLEARGELRQIALRVLGKVECVQDLPETMLAVQDTIKIVSPKGGDLMLPGFEREDLVRNVLRANSSL